MAEIEDSDDGQDQFDPDLQKRYEGYLKDGTIDRDPSKRAMAQDMLSRGIIRPPATPAQNKMAQAQNQSRLTNGGAPTPQLAPPAPKSASPANPKPAKPTTQGRYIQSYASPPPSPGMGDVKQAEADEAHADQIAQYLANRPAMIAAQQKEAARQKRILDVYKHSIEALMNGESNIGDFLTGTAFTYPSVQSPEAQQIYNSGRNFVQGAITPGLKRAAQQPGSTNELANVVDSLKAILNPAYAGEALQSGMEAVAKDNGPEMIGNAVPSMKPGTPAVDALNTLTGLALNPLLFTPTSEMSTPMTAENILGRKAGQILKTRMAESRGKTPILDAEGNIIGYGVKPTAVSPTAPVPTASPAISPVTRLIEGNSTGTIDATAAARAGVAHLQGQPPLLPQTTAPVAPSVNNPVQSTPVQAPATSLPSNPKPVQDFWNAYQTWLESGQMGPEPQGSVFGLSASGEARIKRNILKTVPQDPTVAKQTTGDTIATEQTGETNEPAKQTPADTGAVAASPADSPAARGDGAGIQSGNAPQSAGGTTTTATSPVGGSANPAQIEKMNPDDLKIMPGMQFKKELVDTKNNVTDQLKGQRDYNTYDGGILTVWEDKDGNRFAVDGHHRRELAQRADRFVQPGPNGTLVEAPRQINVQVLRQADGWTPEMARAYGVVRNLKEGKGRAIDAASALVDFNGQDAARDSVSQLPKSALSRDTGGLVELSPDGRSLVANDKVDASVAAGIGKALPGDPARQQIALNQAMGRKDISTFEDGAGLGREVASEDVVTPQAQQLGLDGLDVPQVQSTAAERAILKRDATNQVLAAQKKAKDGLGLDLLPGETIDAAARSRIATEIGDTRGAAAEKIGAAFSFDPSVQAVVKSSALDLATGKISKADATKQVYDAVVASAKRPIADIVSGKPYDVSPNNVTKGSEQIALDSEQKAPNSEQKQQALVQPATQNPPRLAEAAPILGGGDLLSASGQLPPMRGGTIHDQSALGGIFDETPQPVATAEPKQETMFARRPPTPPASNPPSPSTFKPGDVVDFPTLGQLTVHAADAKGYVFRDANGKDRRIPLEAMPYLLPDASKPGMDKQAFLQQRIGELFDTATAQGSGQNIEFPLAPVDATEAAKIKSTTGLDVSGYSHIVESSFFRHAMREHGVPQEVNRGQIPIVREDFLKIPEILHSPDTIEYLGTTSEGNEAIRYMKRIGDQYFYVEAMRGKRKNLASKTLYKRPGSVPTPHASPTPVTAGGVAQTSGGNSNASGFTQTTNSSISEPDTGSTLARRPVNHPEPEPTPQQLARETKAVPEHGVLYASHKDAKLLGHFINEASWSEVSLPASRVSQELENIREAYTARKASGEKIAGATPSQLEHLHDLLSYMSDGGAKDIVVVDRSQPASKVRADRLEGTGHRAVRKLITDPVVQAAKDSPVWDKVSKSLAEQGYHGDKLQTEEALVKIGARKFEELGLTKAEAIDLFKTLNRAGYTEHGDAWLLAMESASREMRGISNATTNPIQRGTAESARSDSRRGGDSESQSGTSGGSISGRGRGKDGENAGNTSLRGPERPNQSPGRRKDYLTTAARGRVERLTSSLGVDFKALPENVQRGLLTWAERNSLTDGAKAAKIAPDVLQHELVTRGIAPPGKAEKTGRAFASWVENTHPLLPTDKALWTESPYELVRLAALNRDPFVETVQRAERFQVKDPKTGHTFYYSPDFKITYKDGHVAYEEIKPEALATTPNVQRKEQAARLYLAEETGNRRVEYRIVSEATLGPSLFKAARDDSALRQYIPSEADRATLDQRLAAAARQARRAQARSASADTRFSRTPGNPSAANPNEPSALAKKSREVQEQIGMWRRVGMFSGIATHGRILSHNVGNAVAEELANVPASLLDMARVAIAQARGREAERTVMMPSLAAIGRSSLTAAQKGVADAKSIILTGKPAMGDKDPFHTEQMKALEEAGIDKEIVTKSPLANIFFNLPMRAIDVEHRLSRWYGFARSLEAQAPLIARRESALINKAIADTGKATLPDGSRATARVGGAWIKQRTADLQKNPTEAMVAQAIGDSAVMAFANQTEVSKADARFRRALLEKGNPGFTAYDALLPVVKTPVNIIARTLEYGFGTLYAPVQAGLQIARTPGLQRNLAAANGRLEQAKAEETKAAKEPKYLIGHDPDGKPIYAKGSEAIRKAAQERQMAEAMVKRAAEEIAQKAFTPEAQRNFAKTFGRGTAGNATIALGYALAAAGIMTGYSLSEQDKKDRDKSKLPDASIRIGSRWFSVKSLGPLGAMLVVGATLREHQSQFAGDFGKATMSYLGTNAHVAADLPQVRGMDTFSALTSGEPKKIERTAGTVAASYVVPGAVRAAAGLVDNKGRAVQSGVDQVKAGVPGLRQTLPAKEKPQANPLDPYSSVPGKVNDPDVFTGRLLRERLLEEEVAEKLKELKPENRTAENRKFLIDHNRGKYQRASGAVLQQLDKAKDWNRDPSGLLHLLGQRMK